MKNTFSVTSLLYRTHTDSDSNFKGNNKNGVFGPVPILANSHKKACLFWMWSTKVSRQREMLFFAMYVHWYSYNFESCKCWKSKLRFRMGDTENKDVCVVEQVKCCRYYVSISLTETWMDLWHVFCLLYCCATQKFGSGWQKWN